MNKIKSFLKNPRNLAILIVAVIILSTAGYLPVYFYSKKNIEGVQTQIISPKTEPIKIEEDKKEELPPATETKTFNPTKSESEPTSEPASVPAQPSQPENSAQKEPSCDETKKQTDVYFENSYHQDLVNIENQRHNNALSMLQKNLDDCLATNPDPAVWCTWMQDKSEENNYHNDQLNSLEGAHQARLSAMNRTCY